MMKKLAAVILLLTIMMVSTSCATDECANMLNDRAEGLKATIEELQKENDELKKKNTKLKEEIEKKKQENKLSQENIDKYKASLDEKKKILHTDNEGLGFTVTQFSQNNIAAYILDDYDGFKDKINSKKGIDVIEPVYSHNEECYPKILYQLLDDEKNECFVYFAITYYPDTQNVISIDIAYDNLKENKKMQEKIDEYITEIVSMYIVSADGPMVYCEEVKDKAKEFIESKQWHNGDVIMKELIFKSFGTITIQRK
jgi:cell division protein FtsB